MRNNTLENLRVMVRAEARISTSYSRTANSNEEYIDQLIKRYYEQLWTEVDWPFARIHKENAGKPLMAGERYYDFPTTLDLERTISLWRKNGNVWGELVQGILPSDYTAMDSDANTRSDPVLKWDVYDGNQFEVWPMPASNTYEVRFDGYRRLSPLVSDQSRCELDDILVALFCAAEVLAGTGQKDAQLKLTMANERLTQLKSRLSTKTRIGFYQPNLEAHRHGPLRIRVPLVQS